MSPFHVSEMSKISFLHGVERKNMISARVLLALTCFYYTQLCKQYILEIHQMDQVL